MRRAKKTVAYVAAIFFALLAFGHLLGLLKILTGAGAQYVETFGGTVAMAAFLKLVLTGAMAAIAVYLLRVARKVGEGSP
jgi:hypothetical protein